MAQIRLDVRQADGYLPPVCMCCGQPATTTATRKMKWCPPWAGGLIGLMLMKHATLQAPLCDAHKGHWFNRNLLMGATFGLFLVAIIGGIALAANVNDRLQNTIGPVVAISVLVMIVGWLVLVAFCHFTMIRPTEITDEEIALTGVAPEFIEAVEEEERARRRRRAARRRERERGSWRREEAEYEDDDDEPERPPRRRRDADERYEKD
jgi:uncharacterized membrane protein YdcZ (DUF606 family)